MGRTGMSLRVLLKDGEVDRHWRPAVLLSWGGIGSGRCVRTNNKLDSTKVQTLSVLFCFLLMYRVTWHYCKVKSLAMKWLGPDSHWLYEKRWSANPRCDLCIAFAVIARKIELTVQSVFFQSTEGEWRLTSRNAHACFRTSRYRMR